jgi:hypothetical protein
VEHHPASVTIAHLFRVSWPPTLLLLRLNFSIPPSVDHISSLPAITNLHTIDPSSQVQLCCVASFATSLEDHTVSIALDSPGCLSARYIPWPEAPKHHRFLSLRRRLRSTYRAVEVLSHLLTLPVLAAVGYHSRRSHS